MLQYAWGQGMDVPRVRTERKRLTSAATSGVMVLEEVQPDSGAIRSSIQSIRTDVVEARYLLVGCADGGVPLYDVDSPTQPLAAIGRASEHHTMGVCVADWYCVDNGIFNVGSYGVFTLLLVLFVIVDLFAQKMEVLVFGIPMR